MSVLKAKSKGNDVKQLQKELNKLGTKPKLKEDGIFGPLTMAAVKVFQKKAELKPDGVVGKLTQGAVRAGGKLPKMKVEEYKSKLNRALVAKSHNKDLATMHACFSKTVDVLEDELKAQVPNGAKMLYENQKHWDEIIKICREIVAKQAEFEAIRLSYPKKAQKLADECEKLRAAAKAIYKTKMEAKQKKADAIFKAARKKIRDAAAKIDAELKALAAQTRSKL